MRRPKVQLTQGTAANALRARKDQEQEQEQQALKKPAPVLNLLGDYGSDDDENDSENGSSPHNHTTSPPPPPPPSSPPPPPPPSSPPPPPPPDVEDDAILTDFMQEIQQIAAADVVVDTVNSNTDTAWEMCVESGSGNVYFWNTATNEVAWECPKTFVLPSTILQPTTLECNNETTTPNSQPQPSSPENQTQRGKKRPLDADTTTPSTDTTETANEANDITEKLNSLKQNCIALKRRANNVHATTQSAKETIGLIHALWGQVHAREKDHSRFAHQVKSLQGTTTKCELCTSIYSILLSAIKDMNVEYNQLNERLNTIEMAPKKEEPKAQPQPQPQQIVKRAPQRYAAKESDLSAQNNAIAEQAQAANALLHQQQQQQQQQQQLLAAGWVAVLDPTTGAMYYHNYATGTTQWEVPYATADTYAADPAASGYYTSANAAVAGTVQDSSAVPLTAPQEAVVGPAQTDANSQPNSPITTETNVSSTQHVDVDKAHVSTQQAKAPATVTRKPIKDKKVSSLINQWKARQAEVGETEPTNDDNTLECASGSNAVPLGATSSPEPDPVVLVAVPPASTSGGRSWRDKVARAKTQSQK